MNTSPEDRPEYSKIQLMDIFGEEYRRIRSMLLPALEGRPLSALDDVLIVALGSLSLRLSHREINVLSNHIAMHAETGSMENLKTVSVAAIELKRFGLGIVQRDEAIAKEERLRIAEERVKKLEIELASANERIYRMRREGSFS